MNEEVILKVDGAVERPVTVELRRSRCDAGPRSRPRRLAVPSQPARRRRELEPSSSGRASTRGELRDAPRRPRRFPRLDPAAAGPRARDRRLPPGRGSPRPRARRTGPVPDPRPLRLPHRRARRVRQREVSQPDRADHASRSRHAPDDEAEHAGLPPFAGQSPPMTREGPSRLIAGFQDSQSRSLYNRQPSSSANFQESTITVTAAGADGGDQHAGGGDLAGRLQPRLLGIADRAGQGVDGAVRQLGDQDQAGPDHQQAPSPLVDAQQRRRDDDQRAAIEVGEEARVAADRRLDSAPARRQLAPDVAADRPGRSGPGDGSRSDSSGRRRPRQTATHRTGVRRRRSGPIPGCSRRRAFPVL